MKLLIEAQRQGYSTNQVGRTLTVAELISELESYDENTPVYISNDNGYTYGAISYDDIRVEENNDEEE